MEFLSGWFVPLLATVLVFAAVGAVLLVRAWPRAAQLSPEEREEMARAPMPALQRRAWWGLAIGGVTFVAITAILTTKGAAAYWDNDDLRMLVVGIFLGGLFAYIAVVLLALVKEERDGSLDERDLAILRRASTAQNAAIIITLAGWLTALPKMFHAEGAVPVVYLYLMFGSVILVHMIGQSAGILLGYWFAARHG